MYQTFAQTIFNRVYQVSTKIIPVCTHHAQAQPPEILNNHPKPKNTSSPNSSKNISAQHATFTVTHPSIPSLEGKLTHSNLLLPRRKLPSREEENCRRYFPSGVILICAFGYRRQAHDASVSTTASVLRIPAFFKSSCRRSNGTCTALVRYSGSKINP